MTDTVQLQELTNSFQIDFNRHIRPQNNCLTTHNNIFDTNTFLRVSCEEMCRNVIGLFDASYVELVRFLCWLVQKKNK